MFRRFAKKSEPTDLDNAIARVISTMEGEDPKSKEYKTLLRNLERLNKLKTKHRMRVSPDAIVTAAASVLGILVIVAYEQKHAMVSKGLGFVMKAK